MPDVLRAQLGDWSRLWWTLGAVNMLCATTAMAMVPGVRSRQGLPRRVGRCLVPVVGLVLTIVVGAISWSREGWSPAPLAYLLVPVGALLLHLLSRLVPVDNQPQIGRRPIWTLETRARVIVSWLLGAMVLAFVLGYVRATVPLFMIEGPEPQAVTWGMRSSLVAALLAPVLTATVAYILIERVQAKGTHRWHRRTLIFWAVDAIAVLLVAGSLATSPDRADAMGTPAAVMFGLAFWMLVVAATGWLSRNRTWVWRASGDKVEGVLGARTPWMAMLVAVWLVAGALDFRAGYQDARTLDVPLGESAAPGRTRTMDDAFVSWAAQWRENGVDKCVSADGSVPLVLVAAPGGGGKAAYWTAYGMDQVFDSPADVDAKVLPEPLPAWELDTLTDHGTSFCHQSLFAGAGVSGGAVGLTTALASAPEGGAASSNAALMTGQEPLARTVASMLLRDIPQPFTTVHGPWRDRAAVLEDAWADMADGAFDGSETQPEREGTKTLAALGRGWWSGSSSDAAAGPVLLLSAASAGDGCRALVSNTVGLVAQRKSCLQIARGSGSDVPDGSVSGAADVLADAIPERELLEDDTPEEYCAKNRDEREPQTVRATTAALLAARFPYVTPSGTVRRCLGAGASSSVQTNYVVDGGYLENTGILTLLQAWDQVAPYVDACNALASGPPTVTFTVASTNGSDRVFCPKDPDGHLLMVEPWFVMLENHYRSRVEAPPSPKRPRELLVPLTTSAKRSVTLGYVPLEQMVAHEISRPFPVSEDGVPACNRFIRLAPTIRADVQAPLGWVLAEGTRASMRNALNASRVDSLRSSESMVLFPDSPFPMSIPLYESKIEGRC
jgi:hypothetical protein